MTEMDSHLESFFREEMIDALYRTTGVSWKTPLDEVPRDNLCDSVSNEFAVMIESEFEYKIQSPVRAPVDGAKHFVAVVTEVPNQELDTPIVVDGTLQQFDDTAPDVLISPIDSSQVKNTYDEIQLE